MTTPRRRRAGAELRALRDGTRERISGQRLPSAAATLTYFSAIGIVPWLLLGLWASTWTRGDSAARARLLELRVLVPPDMGARPVFDDLVGAATGLGVVGALVTLLPASVYGEGLRRACLALSPQPDRLTGWRARVPVMALLLVAPVLSWSVLRVADALVPLTPEGGGGGPLDLLVRVVAGFTVLWLALGVVLTWVFRTVAPGRPRWRVVAVGGFATGSFLAGFLHGFLLFLSLPIDLGVPFGGLRTVGGVVATGLWLYLLHVVVLIGWTVTQALEAQVAGWSADRVRSPA
ncbi:YihY/virulence factor BrkB family protein [Knoellia sp. CPCC 206435]|uniref:YihY/virulence factor BrkB family protein n=1 Tax=Knoellia terrae TaxID=3404797 RepID=UPI003B43377D